MAKDYVTLSSQSTFSISASEGFDTFTSVVSSVSFLPMSLLIHSDCSPRLVLIPGTRRGIVASCRVVIIDIYYCSCVESQAKIQVNNPVIVG